jgi:hypothetical protein
MTPAAKEGLPAVVGELVAKWRGEKDGSGTPWAANYNGALEACAKDLEKALSALSLAEPGEAVSVARLTVYAGTKAITARIHDVAHSLSPGTHNLYTHPAAPAGVSEAAMVSKAQKIVTAMWAAWYSSDGTSPFEPADNLPDLLNQIGNTLLNVPAVQAANDVRLTAVAGFLAALQEPRKP